MAVVVTLCMCGALPVFAAPDAGVAAPDIEVRRQALLQQMLQDPSNLDVAFEYASLSSQVGDYEAAISTLERVIGNWNVGSARYNATGIFAGSIKDN